MAKRILLTASIIISVIVPLRAFSGAPDSDAYSFAYGLFLNNNFSIAESLFRDIPLSTPGNKLAGNAQFMAAEAQFNAGRYAEALRSYSDIIEKYPDTKNKYRQELYYRISECYLNIKDYANSVKYIGLLFANYPATYLRSDAMLLKGEAHFLAGDYDAALDALRELEKEPAYAQMDYVYFLTGRILYERAISGGNEPDKKDALEAIKFFDRVKAEFPESKILKHSEFAKANVYYSLGRHSDAIKLSEKLLQGEADPKFTALLKYFTAWNYYMKGDYAKAAQIYDSLISEGTAGALTPWSEYKKGLCLSAMGKKTEAAAQFARVMEQYKDTVPAAYAKFGAALQDYEKADYYAALTGFEELNEDYFVEELNKAAMFMMADIQIRLEKYSRARELYTKIEAEYRDSVQFARYMQGWCFYREADYKKALDIFDGILRSNEAAEELKAKATLRIGDTHYEAGDFAAAADYYDAVLKSFASFTDLASEAWYGKGWLDYRKDDFKGAADSFTRSENSTKIAGLKARARFMKANSLYSDYNFDQALRIYSTMAADGSVPEQLRSEAGYYMAWCYYRKELFDSAAAMWKKYEAAAPTRAKKADARYRAGWAYFRKNDFDSAIAEFKYVMANYADTHLYQEALLKTGDSYYNKKEYPEAIKCYTELVEKFPQHYRVNEALYGIQWSYYQTGEYEKAVELSKQFVEKYSTSSYAPEIQYRIAEHYYNTKKLATALEEFNRFLDKYPSHELADNACYWAGVSQFELGKYNEAAELFRRLIKNYPATGFADKAYFKAANAYYKLRDYPRAAEFYTAFIEKYPSSAFLDQAYFNVAMTYKRLDKTTESRQWYEKLIAQFPASELNERAIMNLGYSYQDNKEFEKAIETFGKAVALKKDKAVEAQYWIADCYSSMKNEEKALEAYMAIYKGYPKEEQWVVSALDSAAKIYDRQGRLKKAVDAYEKMIRSTTNQKVIDTAKKKIELLNEQYNLMNPAPEGGAK